MASTPTHSTGAHPSYYGARVAGGTHYRNGSQPPEAQAAGVLAMATYTHDKAGNMQNMRFVLAFGQVPHLRYSANGKSHMVPIHGTPTPTGGVRLRATGQRPPLQRRPQPQVQACRVSKRRPPWVHRSTNN